MFKNLLKLSGFKISLLISFGMVIFFMYNTFVGQQSFLSLLDKKVVDFIVNYRGPIIPKDQRGETVVIAVIDTLSVDELGRWPWPRNIIADLIDKLNNYYEARVIALDIVFSEPMHNTLGIATDRFKKRFEELGFANNSRGKQFIQLLENTKRELDGDAKLARTLSKTDNVVLGYLFFNDPDKLKHLTPENIRDSASRIEGSHVTAIYKPGGVELAENTVPVGLVPESNIAKFTQNRKNLSGHFNMQPDLEDGMVRRVHMLMKYGELLFPSLVLQILRKNFDADIVVNLDTNGFVETIEVGGGIINPIETDQEGAVLINYMGPAGTFPHYSISKILRGEIPKEKLEDRIVLVGPTEPGIFDLRTTPVGVAFPGVEVHANVLKNILSGESGLYFRLDFMNDLYSILLILLFGLVVGFTLPNLKPIYGFLFAVGLLAVFSVTHVFMVIEMLTWTSFIYPSLTLLLTWMAVTLFQFLVSDKDKRFIKGAFQQYLSPDVIAQLMDNPKQLQLGGEKRVMTAFFSDVQGFSTISEQLDPTELVQLLNIYLTRMTDLITDVDGTIDKYEGDAIIAFFGAPMFYEDHAIRACQVTLRMQVALEEMRQTWKEEGVDESLWLYQRIGLNTGDMVVGNMGSAKRFDYTMMGNAVNLAARLEGANKNYGTFDCISEYTYEPAKEAIEVRELDLIRVMGIKTPVRIYELVAEKGQLSEEKTKAFKYFAKGLELYRDQQWDESAKYFNAVNKFIPNDPPSSKYIQRCKDMKANPPATDWDGVFEATSK